MAADTKGHWEYGSANTGGVSTPTRQWVPAKKAAPKTAKKSAPKKKPSYETQQFNKLSGQVTSDIAKERKGASPAEDARLGKQIQKDIGAESALTEAGMGHPDAKALVAAGIPQDRVKSLTQQYAADHPANAGTGFTADPTDPQQYAADVLKLGGYPDTASNEKLLETQMTEEGMPGSEDNPLATSLTMPGSSTVNSAGVQEYPSLIEGAQAEAATLGQSNMSSIANALKSGTAIPQQYAAALAGSSYEGNNPTANAAYANSFLTDAGQPEQNFPGGGTPTSPDYGTPTDLTPSQTLADAQGTSLFGNLGSGIVGSSGTQSTNASLQQALSGLTASPESTTEEANTTQAPGSPDQSASASQKTATTNPAALQAVLAQLLPGITPGSAGKNG